MTVNRRSFIGMVCGLLASVYVPLVQIPIKPKNYDTYLTLDDVCFGEIQNVSAQFDRRTGGYSYYPDLMSANIQIECKTPKELFNCAVLELRKPIKTEIVIGKNTWSGEFRIVRLDTEEVGADVICNLELSSTGKVDCL